MADETARPFSTLEALRFGWEKTKAHLKPLLVLGAIAAFLALLNQALTSPTGEPGLRPLLAIVVQLLQVAVTLVYFRSALKVHDGLPADLAHAPDLLADYFAFLLTSILYALIVAVGLVLLIVPGVIWALKFGFGGFLVVDKKLDPIEALRQSSRLTQGVKWQLLGFALVMFGVNLVGALALGVGLLVTIPTTLIAAAYVLRRLQVRAEVRAQPAPQAPAIPPPPTPAETRP